MKVLSIKEPFATLIKDGIKEIETRSWKTNYRGEIYIHASKKVIGNSLKSRNELIKLIEDKKMNYEHIICKCDLVDCVLMTKEYIEEIKKENHIEYICGYYEVGRYAWVLKNIEVLKNPIKAKGKLGIWNYEENTK